MTAQGDVVQWIGTGRGHFTEQGGVSFRGSVYYQTTSEKFASLNALAAIYEHESGPENGVVTRYWEWK